MQTAFQPLFLRPLHSPRMEVIVMKADIKEWDPEDPKKWDKRLAWTTVWISTFSLTFGFCAWYLVPSLAPHLNAVGFHLDASQLYWLVAMVGLSAGTLRILWTFLPPIMGTRKLVFMSTILLPFRLVAGYMR